MIVTIKPTGRINRRLLTTNIKDTEVLSRENLMVLGQGDNLTIKKVPGSSRYNSTSVGSSGISWADRYYSINNRKNFFFSGGKLYFIDENGNTTEGLAFFNVNAVPCSASFRVSSADVMYFSAGDGTGMYSHDGNIGNAWQKEISVTNNFVGMISFLDRIFAFEEDSEDLYFSVNLEPTDFTDSTDAGIITIGAKGGSKIQAIAILNETLYIFKNDSIYVLQGKTPSEFTVREVATDIGLGARHSLVNVEGGLIGLMSDFELWSFGGTRETMKLLTYHVALGGDLTKDLLPIINRDRLSQVRSVYHNFIYRMAFVEDGQTQAKMEYCLNRINETDFFTRGNNIGCYLRYSKNPDKNELVTGRSDIGFMMKQYESLNWDNQASSPSMGYKTQTKFVGLDEPRNMRVRRYWLSSGVLGKEPVPIKMYIDARNAASDATSDEFEVFGESKSPITLMKIASQSAITSRNIPRWNNAKCQNFSLEVTEDDKKDKELSFSSIQAELILTKNLKRSHNART